MAATTLDAILAMVRAVLEAAPLSLVPTSQAFSHDRQPNGAANDAYYLEDAGQALRTQLGARQEARIDRVRLWVTKPMNFAGVETFDALVALGDTVYRALVTQGRTSGWNVEQQGHRVSQPPAAELLVASYDFTVDYDFDASAL